SSAVSGRPASSASAAPGPALSAPGSAAKPAGSAGAFAVAKGTAIIQGYSQLAADQMVPWIAKESGIFAQNGLDVDLQLVASTAVMAALLDNQVQFGTMGGAEVVNADVGGADA